MRKLRRSLFWVSIEALFCFDIPGEKVGLKLAICFFGMNRSLSHVVDSINKNIIEAIPEGIEYQIYGALMHTTVPFTNIRSEEFSCVPESNFENLMVPKSFELIEQSELDKVYKKPLMALGLNDIYSDDGASLMNMVREMYSVQTVWSLASESKPDYVLFLRPDLIYHDKVDFEKYFALIDQASGPMVITPSWQKWGGLNDRFGLANFSGAGIYGKRFDLFWKYVHLVGGYPQAEAILFTTLYLEGVDYSSTANETASRVRAGGVTKVEDFSECGDYKNLESYLIEVGNRS